MIPYSISPNSISVLIDYNMRVIPSSAVNFTRLRDELRKPNPDIRVLKNLVDIPTFIAKVTVGAIRISADEVYYNQEKLVGKAVDRLLKHLADGDPIQPLARLLEKLQLNPNKALLNDLWLWIEAGGLPICEDGDIVAFKKVDQDYRSLRPDTDGTYYDHHIGMRPTMARDRCDENRSATCSTGLHFCSYGYLSYYEGSTGRVVVVKINPRDVVAIPNDHNDQKGRACSYEVIGEVQQSEAQKFFSGNVVSDVGTYHEPVGNEDTAPVNWYDEDYSSDEYEYGDEFEPYDVETEEPEVEPEVPDVSYKVKITVSGHKFNLKRVQDLVASLGQRAAAKKLKVPRSSLQDALKRI